MAKANNTRAAQHCHKLPPTKIKAEASAPAISGNAGNVLLSRRISNSIENHNQRRHTDYNPQCHGLEQGLHADLLDRC